MSTRSTRLLVTLWPYCGRWPDGTRKRLDLHIYHDVTTRRNHAALGTATYPRLVIPLGRRAA